MKPLNTWPIRDRQRIQGIFTDIDDTLTTVGAITPDALALPHQLKARRALLRSSYLGMHGQAF